MGISSYKRHQATGAIAIASTLTPPSPILLVSVKLHLSAVGGAAEAFTVTVNSDTLAAYDVLLFSQDMVATQDILWIPDQPVPIQGGDVIDFAYNNGNTRTYGLEASYRVGA